MPHVRPFRPTDGPALVDLHTSAILAIPDSFYAPKLKRSWAHGLRPEGYAGQQGVFEVVADDEDRAVAFCHAVGDEVVGLYVHPQWQGRGTGKLLLERAERRIWAEGHDRVQIKASLNARGFYEAQGYALVDTTEHKTRGGLMLACLLLEKRIVTSR